MKKVRLLLLVLTLPCGAMDRATSLLESLETRLRALPLNPICTDSSSTEEVMQDFVRLTAISEQRYALLAQNLRIAQTMQDTEKLSTLIFEELKQARLLLYTIQSRMILAASGTEEQRSFFTFVLTHIEKVHALLCQVRLRVVHSRLQAHERVPRFEYFLCIDETAKEALESYASVLNVHIDVTPWFERMNKAEETSKKVCAN